MSLSFPVNSGSDRFRIQWRRLALVLAIGLVAVALFTPLLAATGMKPAKAAVTLLRFAALATLGLGAGRSWKEESALFRCRRPLLVWGRGFLAGALPLAIWLVVLLAIGERRLDQFSTADFLAYGGRYLPLSLLIGFAEDLLFFGFLFAALGRKALPAALLYALAHFLKPEGTIDGGLLSGLRAIAGMGASLVSGLGRPIEVLGLVLVGWVLVGLRRESGSLWPAMGVHGGWFWLRQVGKRFSDDLVGDHEWLFGTSLFYDGLLGWLAIIATGLILTTTMRRRAWLRGEEEG
ncbi:MAG: CPBP family intramembrane metalloprotease [Planctomycetes bacterium]|nr:CPBP family intramembrane metalloprotease [Planctomycetota bacterium]